MKKKILAVGIVLSVLLCNLLCFGCEEEQTEQAEQTAEEEATAPIVEQEITWSEEEICSYISEAFDKTEEKENFKCTYSIRLFVDNQLQHCNEVKLCNAPEGIEYHYVHNSAMDADDYREKKYYLKPIETGYRLLSEIEEGTSLTKEKVKTKQDVSVDYADKYSSVFSVSSDINGCVPFQKELWETILSGENRNIKAKITEKNGAVTCRVTVEITESLEVNEKTVRDVTFGFIIKDGIFTEYTAAYIYDKTIIFDQKEYVVPYIVQEYGLFSYSGLSVSFPSEEKYSEIVE